MSKNYGQFCGLAKASSVLGERWTLLVVRDLSVGPRRFKDLHEGLPGVPTSLLTARLRELEEVGVVVRKAGDRPGGGVFYTLTPYGEGLIPILDALGRWGAQVMSDPAPEEAITDSSLAAALRAGYRPGAVSTTTTYLVYAGAAKAWATAECDRVVVGAGMSVVAPDLVIHDGLELRMLLAGRLSPVEAISSGVLEIEGSIEGSQDALETFVRAFHVPLADTSAVA